MLKQCLSLLFLLALLQVSAQQKTDILHYRFELELDDAHDTIKGSAVIDLRFTENTDQFELDLVRAGQSGKGMMIRDAGYMLQGTYRKNYEHTGDKIIFRGTFRKGDSAEVAIVYKGIPADGLIISKNKYGNRTFFGDNWPNRARHWLPCTDNPGDKASVEFLVTAPSRYKVVANGILKEESSLPGQKTFTHWKEDTPLPTKVMVIGVASFAVQELGNAGNCIPVSTWVYPENRMDGFHDYATAKDILDWHIAYIGPYAFGKLANVQSKTMFGGMENAGAIFYYEGSVSGKRAEEELQSHEIVHQWFGNSATEKSFAHLWLSEGFATYLTHVYMESKYGTDSLNKRMQADRATVLDFVKESRRPVVDPTADLMSLLNANSYQKGGWILHMLRRQLGNEVFHQSIRDYYAAYAGKNADSRDLQQVFEKNAGISLETFFTQWLQRGENPSLKISWNYDEKKNKVAITVEQLQKELFSLPLECSLITGVRGNETVSLPVSKRKEIFEFPVKGPLSELLADPHCSLLAEITVISGK